MTSFIFHRENTSPTEYTYVRWIHLNHRKVDLSIGVRLPVLDIYDRCWWINPLHLPASRYLLYLPFDLQAHHPLWATFNLTVWPVSGDVSRQQVFRQTSSRSSCLHGVSPQRRDMLAFGGLGLNGMPCVGGVPFQHL